MAGPKKKKKLKSKVNDAYSKGVADPSLYKKPKMGFGSMVKKAIGNIIKGDAMNTGDPSKYAITRRALPDKKSGAGYSGD